MKIICNTQSLCEQVLAVSKAVASKSSLPVLEGILMQAKNGNVVLTGYDLEIGITTLQQAEVKEEGEIVLNARLLSEMVRGIDSEFVSIENTEKLLVTIKGGLTEYTILGINSYDFPTLPSFETEGNLQLPQYVLKSMIRQTIFAIAQTDQRPIYTGSLFEIENGEIRIISVDGARLAMRKEKIGSEENYKFVVPGKTLNEVLKMLDDDEEQMVNIKIGKKHILFEMNGYSVISRLLEGEFLDYKASIPGESQTNVNVPTRIFAKSVDKTSLLITDKFKSPVKCTFEENTIKINCSTSIGKASDEISASIIGAPVTIGFASKYLSDALKASETDEVCLQINGPLSPMKIVPNEGDNFLFLVLPVRLKNE